MLCTSDILWSKIMLYSSDGLEFNCKDVYDMEPIDYIVERLDGDYAYLRRTDKEEAELKCVARALLPEEIREGSMLHYEMLEYSMINTR